MEHVDGLASLNSPMFSVFSAMALTFVLALVRSKQRSAVVVKALLLSSQHRFLDILCGTLLIPDSPASNQFNSFETDWIGSSSCRDALESVVNGRGLPAQVCQPPS